MNIDNTCELVNDPFLITPINSKITTDQYINCLYINYQFVSEVSMVVSIH